MASSIEISIGSGARESVARKIIKSSFLLLSLNLMAGFLGYFYQVVAAKKLTTQDYADLLVALNTYSLLLTFCAVIQYFSVIRSSLFFKSLFLKLLSLAVFVISVLAAVILFNRSSGSPLFFLLLIGFPGALLASFWSGAFQGQQLFLAFGLLGFLGSFFKFGLSWFSFGKEQFALSIVLASLAPLLFGVLYRVKHGKEHDVRKKKLLAPVSKDLLLSFVTALGFALYPAYDLFNVKFLFDPETVGRYGQLQLFSRIVYFAPAALLQVTFPYYVKAFSTGLSYAEHRKVRLIELMALGVCYLGILFMALIGPYLAARFIGLSLDGWDIFLASASMLPLYGLISSLQLSVSTKNIRAAIFYVLIVLLSPACALFFALVAGEFPTLRSYLVFSTVINSFVGIVGLLGGERRMRRLCSKA